MTRQSTGDLIAGVGLTALGAYIVWESSAWKFFGPEGPGPGFFPIFYGGLIVVVAIYLAFRSLRVAPAEGIFADDEEKDPKGVWAALAAWVGLALAIPLMDIFGFMAGFGIFTFLLVRFIFGQSYLRAFIVAAAITVALHILFPVLLEVDLPEGMFWGA
ncbi:tripartite tricarboxylate transporter TctB family protein [Ancylobacter sp. MQZ15Z-1]|uniref:Tripartite tricarboxylate transporter TctB family protein n=1 Tax=Ancylobacter mangrovi TaxID=2972472 RepID=A0A9X2PNZ4_9HYPH|nr:tripartite tricarboxylate transporter TctB family protein [Ancylobacter mangrovi]MCS0497188.1 tripartite tricarboxylate transporter TctB family protein [Ancylobacter mangrovi]